MQNNNGSGVPNPVDMLFNPDMAMNFVEGCCSVITRPVELIIRPLHGSRYFSPAVATISSAMMLVLPIFTSLATAAISMIPFTHMAMPVGLFSFAAFAKFYFLLSILQGARIAYLMLHPEQEEISWFEGPPLPFFHLLPKGDNFWFTRIALEPAFVFIAAMTLGHFYIFQSGLVAFFQFSAFALAMKNFIGFYRAWEYIRNILDTRNAGPIIAKMSMGTASQADLAPIHMASFPKNVSEDIRKSAVSHLARAYEAGDAPVR